MPGTFFRNYCNTCTCHADGIRSTCTEKPCGNGEFDRNTGQRPYVHYDFNMFDRRLAEPSRVEDLVPSSEVRCEPEKSFKFYCNTCQCGKDGVPISCTSLHCARGVWNRDGSLVNQIKGVEVKWQNDELAAMQCEPHSSFSYYCNHCFCSESGKVSYCSDMMCPPGLYNRDGSKAARNNDVELKYQEHADLGIFSCEPGTIYCNECSCLGSGTLLYCTNEQCSSSWYNRYGYTVVELVRDSPRAKRDVEEENSLDAPKRVPGFLEFLDHPISCQPKQFFSRYCNFCQCAPDNQSVSCFHIGCPLSPKIVKFMLFPRLGRKRRSTESVQVCEPNSFVQRSCNRCTCNDDGLSFECTIKQCSQ